MSDLIKQPLITAYENRWCLVLFKVLHKENKQLPYVISIHHHDSQEWEETHYLQHYFCFLQHWIMGIIYIPKHSDKVKISSLQSKQNISTKIVVTIIPLSRLLAGSLLAFSNPKKILKTLIGSPIHLKKRLRTAIQHHYNHSKINLSYKDWCDLYDCWGDKEKETLYQSPFYKEWPVIHSIIYNADDHHNSQTNISLNQQWTTPKKATHSYVAILQNGEVLSDHALAIFADQAARANFPQALYADSDMFDQHHHRASPLFKPNIGYLTLISGILTQDIWLFRQDIFESFQQNYPIHYYSAYTHRLALALYLWKKRSSIHHVPFILSHRHIVPDSQAIQEMQQSVRNDISSRQWTGHVKDNIFPLKINLLSNHHPVSLIIPTTISSKIIRNSILSILNETNYPNFELILVISQPTFLTRAQLHYLRPLLKHTNLRVVWLKTNQFNFSQSCNFGIQHTKHNFFAIVNDDIRPKTAQWLNSMMGHMQDQDVGAVGAKLYYPNGQIQHAGIIMGAANLCEHAGRFQHSNRFTLTHDHDVSAVTGACMLIRKTAYDQVQGFDEEYEIAYNDIDFCLKLQKATYRIIQCQQAELIHYESLSLGNHYTGQRAGKERQEILSIRNKWKSICNYDPFYNPNLSLQRGMDEELAFPPRITRPFATSSSNKSLPCQTHRQPFIFVT
ncbi:glycosyltransferase [Commensalibacter nepenthis]|uniref:Glycosyltransferase n=1 Tax=Commensalibacter nepenthis TaxID=3043872 RepID=A0ABT6Q8T9_9PROT|nr:glycosyltransferase [Commensalibacter sp. TBRC 10068]MDI2113316.1 glycosyltransferase [Commensalibacter sp. TBRC 10068]